MLNVKRPCRRLAGFVALGGIFVAGTEHPAASTVFISGSGALPAAATQGPPETGWPAGC